ncbi:TonB-dependent receptor domain-containing protein [Antarcticimicrobium luteum]|uniref:TonB-dependent receptor n=1 Tax=Antarcticimicrobium luteum TaxID=2547397 RepID=A0A4V3AQ27_9RHOB|nr:TonB-dependent receptor [Antarcticimicrobium luteum]TDK41157.1 TonB-dependent receptor [Antarcticimicrobium luteum]
MIHTKPARIGATALLLSSLSSIAVAQASRPETGGEVIELPPITVDVETEIAGASSYEFVPGGMSLAPGIDGGEVLRSVPGVTAGRMGGHGLEVIIRGQQQNQLNIIDAGSFTYGGCPNRMDPPASTAALSRADRVVVERGYSSVTNGPGGTGGTVILERDAPDLAAGKPWEAELHSGFTTNSDTSEVGGTVTFDLGQGFYLKGSAEKRSAGNYTDGSGNVIRSAYDQQSTGLTLGYAKNGLDLAFDVERDLAEDVLFAGAGMDSPLSDTNVYRFRGGVDLNIGALRRIEGNLYRSEVDHVMDNYSLRNPGAMMGMVSPTTSDTTGGKLEAQFDFGATKARFGLDYQSNTRFAEGYMGPIAGIEARLPALQVALSWPDVTIEQTGLYGEAETELSERLTVKYGGRVDYVRATADAAATPTTGGMGMTANAFYTMQYGTDFNAPRNELNVGGLARLEYSLNAGTTLFAGLSRSVRTADATERAMARSTWVGNPDIAPEKHYQLDFGVETRRDNWSVNASVYADHVEDFILRDAFSVPGVTTYRNVTAQLAGVELSGAWERGGFMISGDATYTYGQNTTDDRALAQIPPLNGQIAASYGKNAWRAGARVNWATTQTRIDPARDPARTPGWATLDLFGSYQLSDNAVLLAGVNNVADLTYANHLSRSNVFDPTLTQVNEAGRSLYLKIEARF